MHLKSIHSAAEKVGEKGNNPVISIKNGSNLGFHLVIPSMDQ